MSILRVAAGVLAALFLTVVPAQADSESRVRASDPRLARLLEVGEARSATLRELIARVQLSDLIVHLESAPPGHPIDGGMQFVAAVASTRYVRVTLRTDLPADALMALIGHELRHAVEVAEAAEIRDEASFRNYYQARGRPNYRGRQVSYDTWAAIEAGHRVAVELRTRRQAVNR